MSVSVMGAGAFGTALAVSLASGGTEVCLWARNEAAVRDMLARRENAARLPGIELSRAVTPTADIGKAAQTRIVLLAIPMRSLPGFLRDKADLLSGKRLVACCKGIDPATLTGPVHLVADRVPGSVPAILTGPSFAADIARGLPTALTLACHDEREGAVLQERLSAPNLRLYRTVDTVGAELGGALKNVIAIACGIAIGAGLGESARAAIMTRGYAEMKRLATEFGALPETLSGLSGFGDLALTCTSGQSRNYSFGIALGRGGAFDPKITVEGAATAKAVCRIAEQRRIELPISTLTAAVIDRKTTVAEAVSDLLSRPPRTE